MTVEEEEKLKTYLVRTDAISAEAEEAEFDAWCQDRYESKEGEAEFKAVLAEAKAYALGCSDVLLQKEIMASTYDRILKNLAEVLMSERHRADRPPPGPMGIPIGPAGPRPGPEDAKVEAVGAALDAGHGQAAK